MLLRFVSLMMFLSGLALAPACKTQPSQPPAPLTPVAPALAPPSSDQADPESDLGFLAHLDASHTTIVHLGDVVPHLHRVLRSPQLEAIVRDPVVIAAQDGDPVEIETIRRTYGQFERFIPASMVLGADDSAYAVFVRVVRVMMLVRLCQGAIEAGGSTVVDDLPVLQRQLIDEIEATQMPSAVLWARMRGPEEASSVFDSMAGLTAAFGPRIDVERTDTSVTISLDMDRFFDSQTIMDLLVGSGVVTGPDDLLVVPLAEAIQSRRGTINLTRSGSALVLTLGSSGSSSPPPLRAKDLGPTFDPSSPQRVMWTRWDVRATQALAADTTAVLEAWLDTPAGRAVQATDPTDFLGSIFSMDDTMSSMMLRGQAHMTVSDHLHVDMVGEALVAAIPIDQTPLPGFIPADTVWMELDGTSGLGETLAGTLLEFEERLEQGRMKSVFKDEPDPEAAQQAFIDAYYRHYAPFRDALLEGPEMFSPSMAYVIPRPQSVQGIRLRPRSASAPPPSIDRVPVPELALIGKPRDMAQAQAWLATTYEQFVRATFDLNERRSPRSLRLRSNKDLGLGVPTQVLSLRWIDRVVPDLRVEAEPGVTLHSFAHGEYLVLSTSTRLSQQILRSDDPPLSLPRASLASYGRLDGNAMAGLLVSFFESVRPGDTKYMAPVRALGVAVRVLDEMVWKSWDEDSLRHKTFTLTWTDPSP